LRVLPRGKVPVLEVDGMLLRENLAILSCIGRRFPVACLVPADPLQEANCLSALAGFASTLHIDYRRFIKPSFIAPTLARMRPSAPKARCSMGATWTNSTAN